MALQNNTILSHDLNIFSSKRPMLSSNFGKGSPVSSCVSYKPDAVCNVHELSISGDISSTLTPLHLHESDFNGHFKSRNSQQNDQFSREHEQKLNKILLLVTAGQEEEQVEGLVMKQLVYQQELQQVTKWWNELGFASELKLVRNQPLKWYTWSMVALIDDLSLSEQRVDLTKTVAFVYLIDDIFDLYGTPDELEIFVQAVNRWDCTAVDTLPDYMKTCYRALLETTNETALNIYLNHGSNPIDQMKTMWASLCNAFLVEAKWFASGELPTSEEYLANGIVSSGAHVVLFHLFFLLGLGATKNPSVNLKDTSELVSSAATILRLWDDLGTAKDENQDGKDGSYRRVLQEGTHKLIS